MGGQALQIGIAPDQPQVGMIEKADGAERMADPHVGISMPDSCQGMPAIILSTAERVANPTPLLSRSSESQADPHLMSFRENSSAEKPECSIRDSASISVSSVSSVNWPALKPA